ncbi:MAG: helicase-exonuclease AddAB subunit AddA [Eubacterium pyruvativorans]|uniref:helicase-exonuclease AddAB subunit AddA n=1 Tax=Eubacterium pyruvativorans TaxID=155865 RepID=UPI00240A387D|nr:helicase-exonuclease AddAB subunit AddA [Eubacterium pyruvativorans]MDD6708261.1 helicase-exonuclease AddAB subunit AddA [Eubacterium pyruvativorans]
MREQKGTIMGWTKQQQRAIDERGKSLLVSAAAGSGKTAVMVERITRMITEENYSIDEMLIVTFTNAAASEMREKIRRAMKGKARENPGMRRQLDLLPRANISTFHAFAMEVIRRFFYLTDLEPSFRILDEDRSTILREEALDELLDACYEEGDPDFLRFMDRYSGEKDDDSVRSILKDVYSQIQALPDPFGTLEEKIGELSLGEGYLNTEAMLLLREGVEAELRRARDLTRKAREILLEEGLNGLAGKLDGPLAALENSAGEKSDRWADAARSACAMKWDQMRAKKDESEGWNLVKNQVQPMLKNAKDRLKKIREQFFAEEPEQMFRELTAVSGQARVLGNLLRRFDTIFRDRKNERSMLDFNDIEHFCLEILSDPEAADYYRKKFRAVFIDEYQDTSVLQEAIIGTFCRPDNLFMVGDIKQSIYKFRLAEPEIFRRKYQEYAAGEDAPGAVCGKIDLNRNFRSKPGVLDCVNRIFRPIMEGYDERAMLYAGIPYEGAYNYAPRLCLVDQSSAEEADEEIRRMKKDALEALEVCRLIRENVGKPYYDTKAGEVKTLRYRDIVVLMRSVVSHAQEYRDIMKEQGIPLYLDDNLGFFDRIEVSVFMNLLRIVDNRYRDVPFLSVLRSDIFGFTVDELAAIRKAHPEGSYVEAFMEQARESARCRSVLERLDRWRSLALALPLPDFVWRLLQESGCYMMAGAMPEGELRQANLRILAERAGQFTRDGQSSLFGFIRYIDTVKQRMIHTGQAKLLGENDDVVRLMTIHKSKGLEFPMVIVAGMGSRLRYSGSGGKVNFHKDIGLGLSLEDPSRHFSRRTLTQSIISMKVRQEEVEENIRILYVALTRARDLLFMTGVVKDAAEFLDKKQAGDTSDLTYLGLLQDLPETEVVPEEKLKAPDLAWRAGDPDRDETLFLPDEPRCSPEEAARRLEYRYPFMDARSVRSKYSVSALNQSARAAESGDTEEEPAVRSIHFTTPNFMSGARRLTYAERGTIYHGIMERIDFVRAEREGLPYLKNAVSAMVSDGIFRQEEIDSVDPGKILRFFETPVGRRAADAAARGRLWREQTFNLRMTRDGEDTIVQGIIDCYFEEADGFVLLDYKTNWIDRKKPLEEEENRLRETYRTQVETYRKALEQGFGLPVHEAGLYLFSAGVYVQI